VSPLKPVNSHSIGDHEHCRLSPNLCVLQFAQGAYLQVWIRTEESVQQVEILQDLYKGITVGDQQPGSL